MHNIEVSDDVYEALQRLAARLHCTPEEMLSSLVNIPPASPEAPEPIAAFVIGTEFRAKFNDVEKYLALLSWVAARHAPELGEFIHSQPGGRRYLSMTPEEILETCRRNQARPIEGTPYWAIMNLDTATQRRFLGRLLEFIGYRDVVIEFVCAAFGGRGRRLRSWTAMVA